MTNHTDNWAEWEELFRKRNTDPLEVAAEFLRTHGYLVDTPDSIHLPVQVARSGSFTHKDGYRITLHTRVTVGDRKYGVDYAIDASRADMPALAFVGSIAGKVEKAIMAELMPQIGLQCEQEIARAREGSDI